MITAVVRYRLPETINRAACQQHYETIAPSFEAVPGLISKHFLWSSSGIAGGVYQWQTVQDARRFYEGPWRKGIVDRYGNEPQIEYFDVLAVAQSKL